MRLGLVTPYGTLSLPETVTHIRDFDIFILFIIATKLEDQGFDVRFDFFLGNLFHSQGNSVEGKGVKREKKKKQVRNRLNLTIKASSTVSKTRTDKGTGIESRV